MLFACHAAAPCQAHGYDTLSVPGLGCLHTRGSGCLGLGGIVKAKASLHDSMLHSTLILLSTIIVKRHSQLAKPSHFAVAVIKFALTDLMCIDYMEPNRPHPSCRRIKVMDTRSQNCSHTVTDAHDGCVNCVRWHPSNADSLLSTGTDPHVHLWDLRCTQTPLQTFTGHTAAARYVWQTAVGQFSQSFSAGMPLVVNVHQLA